VFTRDGREGTFAFSLIGLDGPRAPDIVFSLAWSDEAYDGVPGSAVGTPSKLVVDHGSSSPYELHNTLVVSGPEFKTAWRDPLPVGNIDLCPTLTHLLRLQSGTPMDGRVLFEALRDSRVELPALQTTEVAGPFQARGREWVQRMTLEAVDNVTYLVGAQVEPA
jgi:hypothetical protein